jgi:hypothetical protein
MLRQPGTKLGALTKRANQATRRMTASDKLRKTRYEHMLSALPPSTDITNSPQLRKHRAKSLQAFEIVHGEHVVDMRQHRADRPAANS